MRRLAILIVTLGALLVWGTPGSCPAVPVLDNFFLAAVRAQARAQAVLYQADASAFPTISAFMDVFDASGRFVSGLQPQQVTVFEDGQPLPPEAITEMVVPMHYRGHQPGRPWRRYRRRGSWHGGGAGVGSPACRYTDDMSLVTLSGPIISHASARDWLVSLQAFRPDFRDTTPLQTLQSRSRRSRASAARRHEACHLLHHAAHGDPTSSRSLHL
jgi:hypothetical protein